MTNYDSLSYDPPAPVAEVILRDSSSGSSLGGIKLLIDTGADITLLPKSAVERLGVKPVEDETYELLGFEGTTTRATAVDLDMILAQKVFRGRYLLIDAERGILGRDVLAALILLLDGPHQQWSEQTPSPKQ